MGHTITTPTTPTTLVTKTLRQPLEQRPRMSDWLATTQMLFNQVAAFYFAVLDAHPRVLDLPVGDALTVLEYLTHATAANPTPVTPLSDLATQVPAYFRRAAIHAALGARRSFQTHWERWQRAKAKAAAKGKSCQMHPPVPPRTWNRSVVFYAGMWKVGKAGTEAVAGRITLKLYDGQTWRWVRVRHGGREVPDGWELGSPQLVRHGTRWWLHVPIIRKMPRPQQVATQLAQRTHPAAEGDP